MKGSWKGKPFSGAVNAVGKAHGYGVVFWDEGTFFTGLFVDGCPSVGFGVYPRYRNLQSYDDNGFLTGTFPYLYTDGMRIVLEFSLGTCVRENKGKMRQHFCSHILLNSLLVKKLRCLFFLLAYSCC
jgi:hypothetical protein